MNIQSEPKLRRIERASVWLRRACTGLSALVVVVVVAAAIALMAGRVTSVNYNTQTFVIAELSLQSRVVLLLTAVATAGVILKALFHLRRLAGNYARREIFTTGSARQIRQFGISCILWGVIKVIWALLPLVLLPHAPRAFGLTVDSIVMGAVIMEISWFAEMATELREENELTI